MGADKASRLRPYPVTREPLFGRQPGHPDVEASARRAARIALAEGAVLPDRPIELDGIDTVVAP